MSGRQSLFEAAREWLDKADRDLRLVRQTLESRDPLTDQALYHCQQAAEKTIKAYLAYNDQPFPKTHNLATLGKLVRTFDSTLTELLIEADELTDYAWKFRYPGFSDEPTMEEARSALLLAEKIYVAIANRVAEDDGSGIDRCPHTGK